MGCTVEGADQATPQLLIMLRHVCRLIYSSAWDYSVRMWRRSAPHACASVLTFPDWVWSVKPKGHTLLV